MGWGSNWGFSDASKARASAADFFLNTGNMGTPFGGTWCKGSSDCASGYACSGGKCVPITQEKGSDGTLSGCGAPGGGGGCDSYITQGMTAADAAARGYTWSNGVGTKGFNWEPVYSKDGCTITGCAMGPCGGGGGNGPIDCPGPRSCRYDAFGTVNCFCGDPPASDCSEFCTAYRKSNGEDADGCSGLACDECSYCDQTFVSATGECKPIESGSPCHCDPDSVPECNKCNEDGTIESDEANCFKCVEIFNEPCLCNPNTQLSKTCCYPLSEWKQGLSPVTRCKQEIQKECESLCDNNPPYVDPCQGDCESFTVCDTTCPTPPVPPAGSSQTVTGQIEVPGQCCVTYTNCDKTNVPESCSECDCNCHNDCPECELCGADGKCYPDPMCGAGTWVFNGIQNNQWGSSDNITEVATQFQSGNSAEPRCQDGGCVPRMLGASPTFENQFQPTGPQAPFGESVSVEAIGSCGGLTRGCSMNLYDSNGDYVRTLIPNTNLFCPDPDSLPPGKEVGCFLQGSWTFVPD